MPHVQSPTRRLILTGAAAISLLPRTATAALRPLSFAVFRNGVKLGEHHMTFAGSDDEVIATSDVAMSAKLGPVTVYRYRHQATERWTGGRFASLATRTDANGKRRTVMAERRGGGILIACAVGQIAAPGDAAPLTHWNPKAFAGPLFNPQEGKMLKVSARRTGPGHWAVRGEAEIDDWYDDAGAWTALKGKLDDGSALEYRRI
jgi:hypothetical protein